MLKRSKKAVNRRQSTEVSPAHGWPIQSADARSAFKFTALSDAQWGPIHATRAKWPTGIDFRREIDRIGQDYWDAQAAREMWVRKLEGKKAAEQRKTIERALKSTQQLRATMAELSGTGLLDNDFPYPDLESVEHRLQAWLSDYDVWIRPFEGMSNPIQAELESRLLDLWKKAGGRLAFTREPEPARRPIKPVRRQLREPGTPYGPLVDFLTLALHAILGRSFTPAGIAGVIERHRGQKPPHDPFLMYAMRFRITDGS